MSPTGPRGRGRAAVDAVVAPHRPTSEPVHIVQSEVFGPAEEEAGRVTNDRDSGIFSDTASERTLGRVRIPDAGQWKLASVKNIPLVGNVLWLGVSHIICESSAWMMGVLLTGLFSVPGSVLLGEFHVVDWLDSLLCHMMER